MQAEAIEYLRKNPFWCDEEIIKAHIERREDWSSKAIGAMGLVQMPLLKLIDALRSGYEIKPEFKVGDWVVTLSGYIGEIEFINKQENWANIGWTRETEKRGVCLAKTFKLTEIERHARTEEIMQEKERRWWKLSHRDVWQLAQGDILIEKDNRHTCEVKFVEAHDETGTLLVNGIEDEFVDSVTILKNKYEVFCFVHDRRDSRIL